MPAKHLLTLFCLAFFFGASAQSNEETNTRQLCININPKDATIKISGTVYDLSQQTLPYCINLPIGEYLIDIWHPFFQPVVDTIFVKDKKVNYYEKSINKVNPDYLSFKKEYETYKKQKTKHIFFTTLFVIGDLSLISLNLTNNGSTKYKVRAEEAKEMYYTEIIPERIRLARSNYSIAIEEYNKRKKANVIKKSVGIPLAIGALYASYRYWKKVKQNKPVKPVFNSPTNPYSFQMDFDPLQQSTGFTMSYTF